jgi:hypothetical protein
MEIEQYKWCCVSAAQMLIKHFVIDDSMQDLVDQAYSFLWEHYAKLPENKFVHPDIIVLRLYNCLCFHHKVKHIYKSKYKEIEEINTIDKVDYDKIRLVLDLFEDKKKNIIKKIYGIDCKEMNYEDVATEYHMSKQGITSVLNEAFKKIRKRFDFNDFI